MGPGQDTPEEQLLKIIEGTEGRKESVIPPQTAARRFSLRGWKRGFPPLSFELANRLGGFALVALALYVAADLVMAQRRMMHPEDFLTPPAKEASSGAEQMVQQRLLPALSDYLEPVLRRNPFTGVGETETAPPPTPQVARRQLAQMVQSLTIVGVQMAPEPLVMIEDTDQQRTYFLKEGEQVKGMTVERITEGGVVLSYEGEELEVH